MRTEIVQVRDVPSAELDVLRDRAAARSISLSSYLRELIHHDASRPEIGAILDRIATRASVGADGTDIRELIAEGRT
ncbi:hypothetical protein [Nostocoides jenkinsii]|jgi:hypothetical protein|uniref:Antitoxin n=1 Tax=Nostocoides jenkinsii Ben 74 TaxID=1193518 RepID=A0A077MCE6_9MICO|nr:hypothetical protein [Tetrasphaera jenkinsii]CCI52527.1 hypothetical protein BN13_180050 [Tetrasphaera jenkinsii Ben 74]